MMSTSAPDRVAGIHQQDLRPEVMGETPDADDQLAL